jgi:hypothetical protein
MLTWQERGERLPTQIEQIKRPRVGRLLVDPYDLHVEPSRFLLTQRQIVETLVQGHSKLGLPELVQTRLVGIAKPSLPKHALNASGRLKEDNGHDRGNRRDG